MDDNAFEDKLFQGDCLEIMNILICMKYRRKPVVIDAIQWTGDNYHEVFEFTEGNFYPTKPHGDTLTLSSDDDVKVEKGDYITRIANGAYCLCKEAAFNKIYEPVK